MNDSAGQLFRRLHIRIDSPRKRCMHDSWSKQRTPDSFDMKTLFPSRTALPPHNHSFSEFTNSEENQEEGRKCVVVGGGLVAIVVRGERSALRRRADVRSLSKEAPSRLQRRGKKRRFAEKREPSKPF